MDHLSLEIKFGGESFAFIDITHNVELNCNASDHIYSLNIVRINFLNTYLIRHDFKKAL